MSFPPLAQKTLMQDAATRDLTTARRVVLVEILWHQRYFSRRQLILRVDAVLGYNSFGISAWEDTFYRDIRAVKQAFRASGYSLVYRRNKPRPGYYLVDETSTSHQVSEELAGAADELDLLPMDIIRQLSPVERAPLGASLSGAAREVVAYRIITQSPEMTLVEANRLALQRGYA